MKKKLVCTFPLQQCQYEIEWAPNLSDLPESILAIAGQNRIAIITQDSIKKLFGDSISKKLLQVGLKTSIFTFPSGESHKTRETKERIENEMFGQGFGRDTVVIALGGGVVTDLSGYLAATYCRGVPLIMIPTSLLAMVDASIGGKTGVNVPQGKNLIGSIYQPKKVILNPLFLKELPLKEFKNGIVEMLKHGLIADKNYFNFLVDNSKALLNQDEDVLENAIMGSCRIKTEIVMQDERESGRRHLLNFGHTLGHALEKVSDYELTHGEAIAIGILAESYLSSLLGHLDSQTLKVIKEVFMLFDIPITLSRPLDENDLLQAMTMDKKSQGNKPRFVLLQSIGCPFKENENFCFAVKESLIKQAIRWMNDDLCRH